MATGPKINSVEIKGLQFEVTEPSMFSSYVKVYVREDSEPFCLGVDAEKTGMVKKILFELADEMKKAGYIEADSHLNVYTPFAEVNINKVPLLAEVGRSLLWGFLKLFGKQDWIAPVKTHAEKVRETMAEIVDFLNVKAGNKNKTRTKIKTPEVDGIVKVIDDNLSTARLKEGVTTIDLPIIIAEHYLKRPILQEGKITAKDKTLLGNLHGLIMSEIFANDKGEVKPELIRGRSEAQDAARNEILAELGLNLFVEFNRNQPGTHTNKAVIDAVTTKQSEDKQKVEPVRS